MKNKRMKYIENTKQSESGKYLYPEGDCQTYSLAYLLDKDYDEVYKELENAGNDIGRTINNVKTVERVLWNNKYHNVMFPDQFFFSSPSTKKCTVGKLAKMLKDTDTKIAVETCSHLTVIDNGNIVDKWDCSRKYVNCIYMIREDAEVLNEYLHI
jgi:hypothetical protein